MPIEIKVAPSHTFTFSPILGPARATFSKQLRNMINFTHSTRVWQNKKRPCKTESCVFSASCWRMTYEAGTWQGTPQFHQTLKRPKWRQQTWKISKFVGSVEFLFVEFATSRSTSDKTHAFAPKFGVKRTRASFPWAWLCHCFNEIQNPEIKANWSAACAWVRLEHEWTR